MNADKAAKELKIIRQLMERPVRYSTLSGLAGIVAGLAAIAGCLVDAEVSRRVGSRDAFWINLCVWAGVFAVAFSSVAVLTRVRERRQGMPAWSQVKVRILRTLLPPFFAGVGLTLGIATRWYAGAGPNMWGLIPAVWMLFYGVALWQIGEFGVVEIRLLGSAFILSGLICAFSFHLMPYLTIGLTFGLLHVIYGVIVWARHGG